MRLRITAGIYILLLLMIIITLGPVSTSAATKTETLLTNANICRNSLYRSSSKMKYRHNWLNCIKRYKALYEDYPESEQAPWAMYYSARMYTKLYGYSGLEEDLDTALGLYERLTEDYSTHRLADDGQYKRGQIYYQYKKDLAQAYVEFLKVEIKYPAGDMVPKAKEMMDKLAAVIGKTRNAEKEQTPDELSSDDGKLTAVDNIRHWSTPTYTRVVIDLESPVEYTSHLLREDPDLDKPRRLYLDLEKTYVGTDIVGEIPIKDGLLQMARAGQYTSDTVRVVLDIDSIKDYKIFRLHDPFRIVVDVSGVEEEPEEKLTAMNASSRAVGKGIRKPESPDSSVSLARQLGLSVKRIVIDPGHGGKDPGCYFSEAIKEKDIVLDLAKRLKKKIEGGLLGCEVLLTRTNDVFVPLDERTAFANVKKADLFVSLHVNAHKQASIFGLETYFLNMATDERAVMVAARENATSEKNISDLQTILNDLMLNTKISESSKLAYYVQDGMMTQIKENYKTNKSLGVKQAPFYVLIGAEMPAILVETGFITNYTERKRLMEEAYRDMIADGIVEGIESYVKGVDLTYRGG
jgi:N-acetylmuramoyl-L-alanine amidase